MVRKTKKLKTAQKLTKAGSKRVSEEVASFLMPDAPPRKSRRNKKSPERVPCSLVPGTPDVPPPRVPQPWENDDQGGSHRRRSPTFKSLPETAPEITNALPVPTLTSSAEISRVADISGVQICETKTELCDDWFEISTAEEELELDLAFRDPDSDLELEVEDEFTLPQGIPLSRDCPAVDDLQPEMVEQLEIMDRCDDSALTDMASEDMLDFNWSSDPGVFKGQRETFTGTPGPTFDVKGMSPLDVLSKFWDPPIISLIVDQTNLYGEQLKNDPLNKHKFSEFKRWTPITEGELWIFFGILVLQSLISLPVESEYWLPKEKFLKVGRFENMMSWHRFRLIKRCLHFVDNKSLANSKRKPTKSEKITPIVEHLNSKFSSLYLPGREIAIDESLLLWKGRLPFAEKAQDSIKSYELCESKTGYVWKMSLYEGRKEAGSVQGNLEDEPIRATSQTVYDLVRPLLNLGHTLIMDNFYNSPLLSRTLKVLKTDTMGALRLNRKFVPDTLKGKKKNNMRTGEVCFSQTRDLTVVVKKDNNVVSLISTYHNVEVGAKEKCDYYRFRPQVALDYKLFMGGVDKKHQLLQGFPMERSGNTFWYKKLFRRLLNVSIQNAHIIFRTQTNMPARCFRFRIVSEILGKFRPVALQLQPILPPSGHFPAKTGKRKSRCKLCASFKRDVCTTWKCEMCNVNLCMPKCFKEYHLDHLEL